MGRQVLRPHRDDQDYSASGWPLDLGVAADGLNHQLGAVLEDQGGSGPHDGEVGSPVRGQSAVYVAHGHPETAEQLVGTTGHRQSCAGGLTTTSPSTVFIYFAPLHPIIYLYLAHSSTANLPFQCFTCYIVFTLPPWPFFCLFLPYLISFAHIVYRLIFLLYY